MYWTGVDLSSKLKNLRHTCIQIPRLAPLYFNVLYLAHKPCKTDVKDLTQRAAFISNSGRRAQKWLMSCRKGLYWFPLPRFQCTAHLELPAQEAIWNNQAQPQYKCKVTFFSFLVLSCFSILRGSHSSCAPSAHKWDSTYCASHQQMFIMHTRMKWEVA